MSNLKVYAKTIEDEALEQINTLLSQDAFKDCKVRIMPDVHAVFRNSGFVIGTLIMRLSLSAPWPWNIASSIFAAVLVLALRWASPRFGHSCLRKPLPS